MQYFNTLTEKQNLHPAFTPNGDTGKWRENQSSYDIFAKGSMDYDIACKDWSCKAYIYSNRQVSDNNYFVVKMSANNYLNDKEDPTDTKDHPNPRSTCRPQDRFFISLWGILQFLSHTSHAHMQGKRNATTKRHSSIAPHRQNKINHRGKRMRI